MRVYARYVSERFNICFGTAAYRKQVKTLQHVQNQTLLDSLQDKVETCDV